MNFKNWFFKPEVIPEPVVEKEIRVFNASETGIVNSNSPYITSWFYTTKLGLPRNVDIAKVRNYAKNPYVQMVVNTILKQAKTTNWDVINSDEEDETDYTKDIEEVKKVLNFPNRSGDGFWDVFGPFLRDVLEIDSGVIWKCRSGGKLKELFVYDGSQFLFDIDEHAIIKGFYQYSYRSPNNTPLYYETKDLLYGQMNRSTESYPYGFSPLQSVMQEVEVMIQSTRYNKEFFENNAMPNAIVRTKMDENQLQRFKSYWQNEMRGKAHKIAFMNSDEVDFVEMSTKLKDMEWLEGQKWYFRTIFAAYGLSPQESGFYENSNRSTSESQERVSVRNAIRPYYELIENQINHEIIPEIIGHDKVKFVFFPEDKAEEKIEHDQNMALLDRNVITINEFRRGQGYEPVEWGDEPFAFTQQDRFMENSQNDQSTDEKTNSVNEKKDSEDEKVGREEIRRLYLKLLDKSAELKKKSGA